MASYVITASVYVDGVESPEEATAQVESLNVNWGEEFNVQIVLPDEDSGYEWTQSQ